MNGLPYYKAYPRDFIEGTIGMEFEVKCTYRVILDLIYMQGGDLPDDARYISGLLGCSIRKWKSIREKLIAADKIVVSGEFLTNYRALKQLETLSKLRDKNRENGSRSNKNNSLTKATAELTRVKPEPEPDKKEPKGSQKRGTRLPPDWTLSNRNIQDAQACGLTTDEVRHEANKFRDYWISATGAKASKLDWDATWRNWCRNAAERKPAGRGRPVGNRSNGEKLANAFDELQREIRAAEDGPHPWGDDGSSHAGAVLDLESSFGRSKGRG
ncbi:DUF1376 domain-containing protein [Labrenzia sp. OB1]|uniref:DUF1376 domain-containing protein n=1 Tax=Labrenzia sp. OB1 TaxID=1561204 RepID=UPI00083948E1|nr:DUF1376 domain-containing protein [Labrenzia sp. OB1]